MRRTTGNRRAWAEFGGLLREARELRGTESREFSLRRVAQRIDVEPAYLSKIERGEVAPPSEEKIRALARELDQDPDVLLAVAGKVSEELREIIRRRPREFGELLRQLRNAPDHAILRIARQVRDGKW
ncbi:MAG: helix-turn-helix transcriptional regulator [Gammaproteobacteria bacterium]|nr:helix-turn-helix transcriptional regulator [Gammaproteobacteria bacterium]